MELREIRGAGATASSGAQTVTILAQDANRAAGGQGTPTFQVSVLARPPSLRALVRNPSWAGPTSS